MSSVASATASTCYRIVGGRLMGRRWSSWRLWTTMSSDELRDRWRRVTGTVVPRVSPAMLRLALAWEIQASVRRPVAAVRPPRSTSSRGTTVTRAPRAGMRLVREWQGRVVMS